MPFRKIRTELIAPGSERFCWLELFFDSETDAFMDVWINDQKELEFTIYDKDIKLSLEQWKNILESAEELYRGEMQYEEKLSGPKRK